MRTESIRTSLSRITGVAVLCSLIGCGGTTDLGDSSTTDAGSTTATATTVSGSVTSPGGNSGTTGVTQAFVTRAVLPPQPLAGETVQLARMKSDDVGLEAIDGAAATTDANGNFTIPLPDGVTPSADLNVVVGPVEDPSMVAVVTRNTGVDIRPATSAARDAFYELLRGRGQALADVSLETALAFMATALPTAVGAESGEDPAEAKTNCRTALDNDPDVITTIDALAPVDINAIVIESVTPDRSHAGQGQVDITIRGRNFDQDTRAFGGLNPLAVGGARFVSPTVLMAKAGAFDRSATPGTYEIRLARFLTANLIETGSTRSIAFTLLPPTSSPQLLSVTPGTVYSTEAEHIVYLTVIGSGLGQRPRLRVTPSSGIRVSNTQLKDESTLTATLTLQPGLSPSTRGITVGSFSDLSNSIPFQILDIDAAPTDRPTATGISPKSGSRGTSVDITVTGTNFSGTPNMFLSGNWATISNLGLNGSTTATATLNIISNAPVGNHKVFMQIGSNTTTGVTFTVTE